MPLIINPSQLSHEALDNIIMEYQLREDCIEIETDNGHDSSQNNFALKEACLKGVMLIIFDEDNASVSLMHKDHYAQHTSSTD